jgi:hypothetical protein
MIGSTKIDETTNDLDRLQELFDMGISNAEIARIYQTNSGESLSRVHISCIRRGKRWNSNIRGFRMKYEMDFKDIIESTINDTIVKTISVPVITDDRIYYVFLSHINDTLQTDNTSPFMYKKPLKTDLIAHHMNVLCNLKFTYTKVS